MIYPLIDKVIAREGGYVNHPDDRGGPTNMGITLKTLQEWRNHPVTADDVKNLYLEEVRQIYLIMYWNEPKLYKLAIQSLTQDAIFDASVHHGPSRAVKLLQTAVGAKPDGLLGPKTLLCVNCLPEEVLLGRFLAERVAFLGQIITSNPSQAVFAHGWFNRMAEFISRIHTL